MDKNKADRDRRPANGRASRPARHAITIREVAKRANVSTATVSRALSAPQQVTEETRARVLKAISETGYTPNASARNLRSRSTRTVLCLLPGLGNSFWNLIVNTIEDILTQAGYGVLLGDTRLDPKREAHYEKIVRAGQVDGVLVFNGRLPSTDFVDLAKDLPIILISNDIPGSGLPVFEIDNRDAARRITDHLIEAGHRRIAHISGPPTNIETRERENGYRHALSEAGIPFDPCLVWTGGFSFPAGKRAAEHYFQMPADQRPTAVFAASDECAIGFIKAVSSNGCLVPEDVSVAGFDGVEFSELCHPPLTTMVQPRIEMGRLSAEYLIRCLNGDGDAEPPHIRLQTTMVIRDSVSPPKVP